MSSASSTHSDPAIQDCAPPAVSILWDIEFFKNVLNVTLSTDLGPVDLLAEAPGVEGFEELWTRSPERRFGHPPRQYRPRMSQKYW